MLKAPTFELGESGHLVVEPEIILHAYENRRVHVKKIVSRMLDPLAVMATQEKAVFRLTDSVDQWTLLSS